MPNPLFGVGAVDAIPLIAAGGAPRFIVHKFGKNTALAAGETIMEPGQAFPYLTYDGTAIAVRVKAGGSADDTVAGDGARKVTIAGLDANFEPAFEVIELAGASASAATTTTFSRVLRAQVSEAGTNRRNTADIVIEDAGGAADYATILASEGQSQLGFVTVPRGYRGRLAKLTIATSQPSATGSVAINSLRRERANRIDSQRECARVFLSEVALTRNQGILVREFDEPIVFDEMTDVWFEATATSGTPAVSVYFNMLFDPIQNPYPG